MLSILFLAMGLSACNTRTKVEPCDFSYVVACGAYYSDDDEFQACLTELGGASCSLSTDEIDEVNASLAAEITSYTCSAANPWVQSVTDKGYSVTHIPDSSNVIYVDQFHNPLAEFENFSVTSTITGAIEVADAGDTIVVCPSEYPENLVISGESKDGLKILNIAGGTREMADYTFVIGELGSSLEINGTKGVEIKGLSFKNGNASVAYGDGYGGGARISVYREAVLGDDRIRIFNSVFQDNQSDLSGGGIYLEGYVDLYLNNVDLKRNAANLGTGGAIHIEGHDEYMKRFLCVDCSLSQNSAYFSGSAISANGSDYVVMSETEITLNQSDSDLSLAAILIEDDVLLYGENIDWGTGTTENQPSDIILSSELNGTFSVDAGDLWTEFVAGSLTAEYLESLYESYTSDDALFPGQYDYTGQNSFSCNSNQSQASCLEF